MNIYECLMPYCRADVYARGDCCEDCWADRVGQLAALPELYVMTYAMLTPGSRQQEINTIHMAAIDPAALINLVALDTLTYSYSRSAGWAAYVYPCRLNLTGYTSGRAFVTAVAILQEHDHKLALTTFAGGYVRRAHRLPPPRRAVRPQRTAPPGRRLPRLRCRDPGHATRR